jgi:hypothetical protein
MVHREQMATGMNADIEPHRTFIKRSMASQLFVYIKLENLDYCALKRVIAARLECM